jgi:hypothetical protein
LILANDPMVPGGWARLSLRQKCAIKRVSSEIEDSWA